MYFFIVPFLISLDDKCIYQHVQITEPLSFHRSLNETCLYWLPLITDFRLNINSLNGNNSINLFIYLFGAFNQLHLII